MTNRRENPPRLAQALLRAFVRPCDAESIPGDLLEEYREVKRPSLGKSRADWWYIKHMLSVLWRVVWPSVAAMVALRVLTFPLPRGWNPSFVQAPGVSALDAMVLVCAGYYAAQRTNRVASGVLTSVLTSISSLIIFFTYALVRSPSLLLAPFEKPFIFVIIGIVMAIAVGFSIVVGSVGAAASRLLPPALGRVGS